jgi:hypothetical protein
VQRSVEAEAFAHERDLLLGGAVADVEIGRVAGHVERQEGDQRDRDHHDGGLDQAAEA